MAEVDEVNELPSQYSLSGELITSFPFDNQEYINKDPRFLIRYVSRYLPVLEDAIEILNTNIQGIEYSEILKLINLAEDLYEIRQGYPTDHLFISTIEYLDSVFEEVAICEVKLVNFVKSRKEIAEKVGILQEKLPNELLRKIKEWV